MVGLGYWGPNLARNFDRLPDAELGWICDATRSARERGRRSSPALAPRADLDELLADPGAGRGGRGHAAFRATPTWLCACCEAGKHCFVEKPLAQSVGGRRTVVEPRRAEAAAC